MAFRGDMHGASNSMPAGMGLIGGQAASGIEKNMIWKLAFFSGAAITTFTAIFSLWHYVRDPEWAPATFLNNMFLLFFGFLLIVLDFPIPHPYEWLVGVRDNIYKFMLFLTRFTGRGFWYIFLATQVFCAISEGEHNWILGSLLTVPLILLGIVATVKGMRISYRLDQVRQAIRDSSRSAEHYLAPRQTGLRKVQFKAMVESATSQRDLFDDDELDYVINALSFTPENDGQVSMEEVEYWLSDGGPMLMV